MVGILPSTWLGLGSGRRQVRVSQVHVLSQSSEWKNLLGHELRDVQSRITEACYGDWIQSRIIEGQGCSLDIRASCTLRIYVGFDTRI